MSSKTKPDAKPAAKKAGITKTSKTAKAPKPKAAQQPEGAATDEPAAPAGEPGVAAAEPTTDGSTAAASDAPVATHAATDVPGDAVAPKRKQKARATAPTREPGGRTLADLTDAYIHSIEDAGHSESTCRGYRNELGLAEEALGETTPVASITAEQVQKFFRSAPVTKTRDGLPKAQLGVDKTRRVLRLALVWAVHQGWIETAPLPETAKA